MIFLCISFLLCIFSLEVHLDEYNDDGFRTVTLTPQTKKSVDRIEIIVNTDVLNENTWDIFRHKGEFSRMSKDGKYRPYKVTIPSDIKAKKYIACRVYCDGECGYSRALYKRSKHGIILVPIDPKTGK
ncbi:hypothetical protein H311_03072, partial [Anncaliia algerae PRA109]